VRARDDLGEERLVQEVSGQVEAQPARRHGRDHALALRLKEGLGERIEHGMVEVAVRQLSVKRIGCFGWRARPGTSQLLQMR
jgi:hypothetical protein